MVVKDEAYFIPGRILSSNIFKKRTRSELLWVGLTRETASPVSRSMAASSDSVPSRTYP